MDIKTHNSIDQELCGKPLELGEGYSRVELQTTLQMAADETGLVHGGFIFGLARLYSLISEFSERYDESIVHYDRW